MSDKQKLALCQPTEKCKTGRMIQYSSKDIDLLLTRFVDCQPSGMSRWRYLQRMRGIVAIF